MIDADAINASRMLIDNILETESNAAYIYRLSPYTGDAGLKLCQRLDRSATLLDNYLTVEIAKRTAKQAKRSIDDIREKLDEAVE